MSMTTISTSVENFEEQFGTSDVQCNNGDISVLWATTANINTQNRAYQREKVSPESWKKSLMETVLVNTYAGIPEIHIRVVKTEGGGYRYELIDGQQRITAITDFLNGVYPLPQIVVDGCDVGGMYATKLLNTYPKVYQRIMDYRISCKWYEDLTDLQTAHLFIEVLNNTNDMKEQEIRNAVLGHYSDYVRDTARGDKTRKLDPHPLFNRYIKIVKGEEKEYLTHFSSKFTLGGRMEVDEWLSSFIYLSTVGVFSGISHPAHTQWVKRIQGYDGMYAAGFTDADKTNKHLNFALSLMQSTPKEYKVKLNPMKSLMLVMYAIEMQNRGYEVVPELYTPAFFDTYTRWSDTDLALYAEQKTVNGNQMPPFDELFGGKNSNAIGTIFKVLDMDFAGREQEVGLIKIDPRDSFSRADILKKWQEQGGKCFYTGEPIAEDNLAGDHYIPRSLGVDAGGVTEYENLVVCSKRMNIKKSNIHGDDFVKKIAAKEAA